MHQQTTLSEFPKWEEIPCMYTVELEFIGEIPTMYATGLEAVEEIQVTAEEEFFE